MVLTSKWFDLKSVKDFSWRDALTTRLFKLFVGVCILMLLLLIIDIYFKTPLHWFPELVGFFLIGIGAYKFGLRKAFSLILLGTGLIFFIDSVVNENPWGIPLALSFLIANLAGFLYARRSSRPSKRVKKLRRRFTGFSN